MFTRRFAGFFVIASLLTIGIGISVAFAAVITQKRRETPGIGRPVLIGADQGLYQADRFGICVPLWSGGSVKKIIKNGNFWIILSSRGILVSSNLLRWEGRNRGLPVKTIKAYENRRVSFIPMVQDIKDLELDPANPNTMVCAVKDRIFLSRNAGRNWEDLGAPPHRLDGIKAAAVASLPETTVFLSHSFYGVYYLTPGRAGAQWTALNEGLEKLETTGSPDEISDIAVTGAGPETAVFVSQTFRRRIYRLDWGRKRFIPLWGDAADFGTVDSLDPGGETLRFVREGMVAELPYPAGGASGLPPVQRQRPDLERFIRGIRVRSGLRPASLLAEAGSFLYNPETVNLSELWLLDRTAGNTGEGKNGIYLPVDHALSPETLRPYLDLIRAGNLNMLVIDMKDDFGRLRFSPRNPAIAARGRVFRPVDIDAFLRDMKARGIYTVARIVVFKDPELVQKEQGRYAVWDAKTNQPWKGYYNGASGKTYYNEDWVDPYSEEVWEYIAAAGAELHARGFDEIQFDYIRFPTDGVNLADAQYRWKNSGMDMESAILSFLRHIRSRIKAPISIDIYGSNGWYRTGARTGQEAELLASYVDIICPMYYPSHFEQRFLAQPPPELRPYRIYYQGTLRARRITRGRVTIRPYVQAFYLDVSYDETYYNPAYVRREAEGVRRAGRGGLTYWNNSGRYGDIPMPGNPRP